MYLLSSIPLDVPIYTVVGEASIVMLTVECHKPEGKEDGAPAASRSRENILSLSRSHWGLVLWPRN